MFKKPLKSSISTIILFLLFLTLLIVIFNQIFITKNLNNYIKYDSILINRLGQIRGDIQRYVKLKLVDDNKTIKVQKEINSYFKIINFYINNYPQIIPSKYIIDFYNYYNSVEALWNQIVKEKNKRSLLMYSEQSWENSNELTCLMAKISQYKIKKLNKIILYISIILLSFILLIITVIYILVKNGIEKSNITDPLTKLYNRLYFDEQIEYFLNKYYRDKKPFSILLLDIDNFKKINDTYGHHIGDEVLIKLAKIIKENTRKTDLAFRFGGEEFIILFPETNLEEAYEISERLREAVQENIQYEGKSVTFTGGLGEFNNSFSSIEHFIHEIDNALYFGKKTGKNKIVTI